MSFGRDTVDEHGSLNNYGIAINSSDDFLALPPRAISLFETTIHPERAIKVSYNFRGILGTLPPMKEGVKQSVYKNMENTQGIYTDNMYIGDENQYLAFYEDEQGDKHLKISAREMIFSYDPETGEETTWEEKIEDIEASGIPGPPGPAGEDAVAVRIESNIGNNFVIGNTGAILTCYVYQGDTEITSQITKFEWSKKDKDGNLVLDWIPEKQGVEDGLLVNQIYISANDVDMKSVFCCNVTFA